MARFAGIVIQQCLAQDSSELFARLLTDVAAIPPADYPVLLDGASERMSEMKFERFFVPILARKKQMRATREKSHAISQWMALQPRERTWTLPWQEAALAVEEPLAVAVCAGPGNDTAESILRAALPDAQLEELPVLVRGLFQCASNRAVRTWFDVAETIGKTSKLEVASALFDLLELLPKTCDRGIRELLKNPSLEPAFLDMLHTKAEAIWGTEALEA